MGESGNHEGEAAIILGVEVEPDMGIGADRRPGRVSPRRRGIHAERIDGRRLPHDAQHLRAATDQTDIIGRGTGNAGIGIRRKGQGRSAHRPRIKRDALTKRDDSRGRRLPVLGD